MTDQVKNGRGAVSQFAIPVVLLLAMAAVGTAGGPIETASFALVPGIVVDSRLPAVFLMAPDGGIEAIEPHSGGSIWRSGAAARPLLVVGGTLVAQAEAAGPTGGLPLVFLEAHSGGHAGLRAEVPLPRNVSPLVNQGLGIAFSVRAWEESDGVVVAWGYVERDVTGVSPRPGEPPFRHRASGASRIDMKTGQVTPLAAAAEPTTLSLPEPVQRAVDAGELRRPPWRAGAILAATADRILEDGGSAVALQRWEAQGGEPLPEVILLEGRAVARVASADRRHLMLASMLPPGGAGAVRYLWSIFSLATGERLGEVRRHASAPPFCVLGHILLHQSLPFGRRVEGRWLEEPLKLRAVDLESGDELWSRAVRDTAFTAGMPPGQ